jgi:hypothetical protein
MLVSVSKSNMIDIKARSENSRCNFSYASSQSLKAVAWANVKRSERNLVMAGRPEKILKASVKS